nr:MAG TPA: hypothetical protein [Caudoviricetes sp.]
MLESYPESATCLPICHLQRDFYTPSDGGFPSVRRVFVNAYFCKFHFHVITHFLGQKNHSTRSDHGDRDIHLGHPARGGT